MAEDASSLVLNPLPSSSVSDRTIDPRVSNNAEREAWTLTIRPKTGWFDLQLGELWRYRDLVLLYVRRDFVAKFEQTILGPLWFIIQPILTTVTFTVIFGNIALALDEIDTAEKCRLP